jgi:hypothetical protein
MINLNELVLLRYDPVGRRLLQHTSSSLSIVTETDLLSMTFASLYLAIQPPSTVLSDVAGMRFFVPAERVGQRPVVEYQMRFRNGSEDQIVLGTVALRQPARAR